jgi:hypothetical protein
VSASRHYEDCHDRPLLIAASPTNQVVAVASGFKSDLGNRSRIINQLDSNEVEFSFQSFLFDQRSSARVSIQMRTGFRIHRIKQFGDLNDNLPPLPYHELFALESRQMLRHSGPRGSDQVGDVLVAERYA